MSRYSLSKKAKKIFRSRRSYAGFFVIVALLAVFWPSAASAGIADFFGIPSLTEFIGGGINILLYLLNTSILKIFSWAAQALDMVLKLDMVTSLTILQPIWGIVRNFANMFFIVFLIIMAFATIFDLGGSLAGYDIGSLLAKFLIAALLINFSMVIGREIITLTNVVNGTFTTSIGGISDRILKNLGPSRLVNAAPATVTGPGGTQTQTNNVPIVKCGLEDKLCHSTGGQQQGDSSPPSNTDSARFHDTVALFFTLILSLIALVSMLVPLLFAIIRIPIIWFLLVMSPLAWLCSVLPATRDISKSWWKHFWGWNLFVPIYLFFLSMSMYILGEQDNIMTQLYASNPGGPIAGFQNFFQMVFFYIFVAIAMLGGLGMAFKSSFIAGTGASGAANWARGAVARFTGVTATGRALKQRGEQFQKEGLGGRVGQFLYGGQTGLDKDTARMGQIFGVRGSDIAKQKPFVEAVGREYGAMQDQFKTGALTPDQIRAQSKGGNANDAKTLAIRKMAAEMGMLTPEMLSSTATELNRNPLALNSFIESAKKGKFMELSPKQRLAAAAAEGEFSGLSTPAASDARREIFTSIAEDKKAVKELTETQYRSAVGLYGGASTVGGRDFIKKVNAQRLDLAVATHDLKPEHDRKYLKDVSGKEVIGQDGKKIIDKKEIYKDIVSDSKAETLADIHLNVWKEPEFQEILFRRFERYKEAKNRAEFYSNLTKEIDGNSTDKAAEKDAKTKIADAIYDKFPKATKKKAKSSSP